MTLKFYTLFTLLFMILLGNFIFFFITKESIPLEIFNINFTSYPVAIWIIVPFIIFYILNVILMSISNIQNYFKLRTYDRDFDKLKDAFYNAFLYKDKHHEFKTNRYKLLGDLVSNTIMIPKKGAIIENDIKIQTLFVQLQKLNLGDVVNLEEFSLPKDNYIMIQNAKNSLKNGDVQAEVFLINASYYDESIIKKAFLIFAKTASLTSLIKYKDLISMESLIEIVNRVGKQEDELQLSLEDIISLSNNLSHNTTAKEYIKFARSIRVALIPEERIKLFDKLLEDKFDVSEALLYTYLDLEMLEMARELLDNYNLNDFPRYRAFIALKDINYACNIDLFIT